jgi:peptide/nickel transport system permease protein
VTGTNAERLPQGELPDEPAPREPPATGERLSEYWDVLRSNRLAVFGLSLLPFFAVVAIFAPLIAPFDPDVRVAAPFQRPDSTHLLGTNDIGQDIFSEVLVGSRVSLSIGLLAALSSITVGCLVGLSAGYFGGKVDSVLMRFVDMVLVIPFLPLVILLAAYLGPSFWNLVFVIGLLTWAQPARIIRSLVLSLKTRGYVEAGRAVGTPVRRILRRHILPGVIPLTLSQFVLAASQTILIEASLSFLGLGDPTTKSWGSILFYAQARGAFLTDAWLWWIVPPGVLITLVVVGFAFAGLALEEMADPKLRRR